MYRRDFVMALSGLLLLVGNSICRGGEKEAIESIEKLGGKVERDNRKAGKPVIKVDFASCEKLKNDDLKVLKGFPQLEWLSLNNTAITDAGLAHVKDLKKLKTLGLADTRITDKGLDYLKGLKNLDALNLNGTKVSQQGVARIQKSMPKAIILSNP
jgi:hypothetical protein